MPPSRLLTDDGNAQQRYTVDCPADQGARDAPGRGPRENRDDGQYDQIQTAEKVELLPGHCRFISRLLQKSGGFGIPFLFFGLRSRADLATCLSHFDVIGVLPFPRATGIETHCVARYLCVLLPGLRRFIRFLDSEGICADWRARVRHPKATAWFERRRRTGQNRSPKSHADKWIAITYIFINCLHAILA